jgi:hypothetical protein
MFSNSLIVFLVYRLWNSYVLIRSSSYHILTGLIGKMWSAATVLYKDPSREHHLQTVVQGNIYPPLRCCSQLPELISSSASYILSMFYLLSKTAFQYRTKRQSKALPDLEGRTGRQDRKSIAFTTAESYIGRYLMLA